MCGNPVGQTVWKCGYSSIVDGAVSTRDVNTIPVQELSLPLEKIFPNPAESFLVWYLEGRHDIDRGQLSMIASIEIRACLVHVSQQLFTRSLSQRLADGAV